MRFGSLSAVSIGWRLRSSAAVVMFVALEAAMCSSTLAAPTGRVMPAAVAAATAALLTTGFAVPRAAVVAFAASVPAVLLAAGFPLGELAPGGWHRLVADLGSGARQAIAGTRASQLMPGSAAAVMLGAGALWTMGAALGASGVREPHDARSGRRRLTAGFILLAAPWLFAACVNVPDRSVWQGTAVLLAGVIWFCGGGGALALAALVSVPSAAMAYAEGPASQWFGLAGHGAKGAQFRALDPQPSYGPLTDRRSGATMLVVTAPAPALWRVQTLDYWDGRWIVESDGMPPLPQPAARPEEVGVRVVGLRENLAVAPGRIERIRAPGQASPTDGEGMLIAPMPEGGATYRVRAAYVHATAAQLSRDRAPLDAAARAYTRVGPAPDSVRQLEQLGSLTGQFTRLVSVMTPIRPDPGLVALARRLARGATSEWEIVENVERYLLGGGRFRYTTSVPYPGSQPLADFLLRTHAGYCQQFAGAAALLLRLDGVPARVVSGFATGTQIGVHQYAVRDLDAHEWIEVYFEGYGWVPFNPTPAADPASIVGGIDAFAAPPDPARAPEALYLAAGLIALAAGGTTLSRRRRRGSASTDWLWRVARRAGGAIEPSTTLAEVRPLVAARIGPRTAALVFAIERERFAGDAPAARRPRMRVTRALVGDLGPLGSLLLWVGPRRQPTPSRSAR